MLPFPKIFYVSWFQRFKDFFNAVWLQSSMCSKMLHASWLQRSEYCVFKCFLVPKFKVSKIVDDSWFQSVVFHRCLLFLGSEVNVSWFQSFTFVKMFDVAWFQGVQRFCCFLVPKFQRFVDVAWSQSSLFQGFLMFRGSKVPRFKECWCFVVPKTLDFNVSCFQITIVSKMFDVSWFQSFEDCLMFLGSRVRLLQMRFMFLRSKVLFSKNGVCFLVPKFLWFVKCFLVPKSHCFRRFWGCLVSRFHFPTNVFMFLGSKVSKNIYASWFQSSNCSKIVDASWFQSFKMCAVSQFQGSIFSKMYVSWFQSSGVSKGFKCFSVPTIQRFLMFLGSEVPVFKDCWRFSVPKFQRFCYASKFQIVIFPSSFVFLGSEVSFFTDCLMFLGSKSSRFFGCFLVSKFHSFKEVWCFLVLTFQRFVDVSCF